jgi:hypothetical protein
VAFSVGHVSLSIPKKMAHMCNSAGSEELSVKGISALLLITQLRRVKG